MINEYNIKSRSPYGTWKCKVCDEIFETRALLKKHNKATGHGKIFCKNKCKGKTYDEIYGKEKADIIKKKVSTSLKKCYKTFSSSEANKIRISRIKKTAAERHSIGGLRKGSGRGKKGWYKGYWCDSSWELAYVIWCLEHNIKIERNKEPFEYLYNNQVRKYYPDFILENGSYVEIKGYYTKQTEEKINAFPKNRTLILIDKHNIKEYLNYVENKYGKDFYNLYENNKGVVNSSRTGLVLKTKGTRNSVGSVTSATRKYKTYKKVSLDRFCKICGKNLNGKQKHFCCKNCYDVHQARNIPNKETLISKRNELKSRVQIGKYFGVSDNTIKKWLIKYNIL